MTAHRLLLLGGVVGPIAFLVAWVAGGIIDDRQLSAIDDAISQLANVEADTRWLMTAGFFGFGLAVAPFAFAIRPILGGPSSLAYVTAAASTVVVGLLPLGRSDAQDDFHAVAAGIAYIAFASAPASAFRRLARIGHRRFATVGVVVSSIAGVSLAVSLTSAPTGVFQRLGLTALDGWTVALAVILLSRSGTGQKGRPVAGPTGWRRARV
ncbi:DUF998 domain-containing protein [Ilumatobacter sp.]|uniref:DUF998 domain-containing protein n=1 Tax=Ilumatobacter sp. TaxID=1967498 RepID=UPI003C63DF9A